VRSIGYDGIRPLKCGSARKIVRNWIRLDMCEADVGDDCRFKGWRCSVGTWRGKRIVGCYRPSIRAITFKSRYR
jgi:hypothetical protein